MTYYRVIILLLYHRLLCVDHFVRGCQVAVAPPWEMKTFIPRGSTTYMNCTATNLNQTLRWSLQLPLPGSDPTRLTTGNQDVFGGFGFYNVSQDDSETIVLLVNGTVNVVNSTIIKCVDAVSLIQNLDIDETTLVVYEPTSIDFRSKQIEGQLINISWSPLPFTENAQTYNVTINDSNKLQTFVQLSEPYFLFTAPEDAPPCKVYNFSVTATYVGATYTGDGCSAPSPVLSTMLPSLPDTIPVESSIQYVLIKQEVKLIINVTFEPAKYCGEYPIHNYTLEVKGQSSEVLSNSIPSQMQSSIVIHNLTENTNYSFRVLVSNSVGVVSTKEREFITTDVQNVTATPVETLDAVVVQCDFITGSNAQGCMVVFVDEFGNITRTINIINSCIMEIINSTDPLSFHEVFAYDIESDGSIGTLAVPGVIIFNNLSVPAACPSTTTTATMDNAATYTTENPITVVIAIGSGAAIILICIIILCMIISIAICCKVKRSKKRLMVVQPLNVYSNEPDTNGSELAHCTDEELEIQEAEIFYEQPIKARERCSGDGAEHGKTKHIKDIDDITVVEREMNTYAELTEENHHYHTLEPQRVPHGLKVDPDAPALPPPYRPPSPEPLPLYQEIGSLQVVKYDQERDTTNGEIVNDQYQPSPNQPPSDEAQVSSEAVL